MAEQETGRRPSIKEWADDDKPREKLTKYGAGALSEAELLAILIGSGNAREDAVELMRRILKDCGNSLKRLGHLAPEELCRNYCGIGMAKAVTILAACELGNRRGQEVMERSQIGGARDIYEYFIKLLRDTPVEECHVMLLNQAHRVIGSRLLTRGGIARTLVDMREVLRCALLAHAPAIVLCHNHPSGNITPSLDDDRITERLDNAARMMEIRLLDHLIITDGMYYSYADHGKL